MVVAWCTCALFGLRLGGESEMLLEAFALSLHTRSIELVLTFS